MADETRPLSTGWRSLWTRASTAALLFLFLSGAVITFAPFHATVEWTVLVHTVLGLLALLPLVWYLFIHWRDYRRYNLSDAVLLGYVATAAILVCLVSGVWVTWQGLFGLRMSPLWRNVHLISTWAAFATVAPHLVLVLVRSRRPEVRRAAATAGAMAVVLTVLAAVPILLGTVLYSGVSYTNEFPEDYNFVYGEDRPFAPSLAVTTTGGAFDAESLAGSQNCGSAGCHSQIVEEWTPSAHRYAAMDPLFQKVQSVMAEQNGPESTRYCGGCHDPISLFSGTKNVFAEDLTGQHGYNEGVSCLVCHGIRQTDLQGNANYVMTQPPSYLWQWHEEGLGKYASDFLIRTYPDQHNELSKRMFKAPEYCAACHKQFIDQEVNRVGWVQLQNQYDNWKASHWFVDGQPEKSIECRECHMPLVESTDPASGDETDYNRTPGDGRHRSHRFIAANSLVPSLLELDGWEKQVELTKSWLKGELEVPEIEDKWRDGPVVQMALHAPEQAVPGETLPIQLVLTANKVGHDFPTGPLDIIQSWVELHVVDGEGRTIFSSGTRDEKHFIEPGSFLFKAEPVDQYGNLIDRHNLWEMVGVRYRRALFPGYSDTVEYLVDCPSTVAPRREEERLLDEQATRQYDVPVPMRSNELKITAILQYRKVDQYLINFLLGEDSGLTAPVVEMNRVTIELPVASSSEHAAAPARATAPLAAGGGR